MFFNEYTKAADLADGRKVSTNAVGLIKYKNDWGSQQHPPMRARNLILAPKIYLHK